MTFREFVVECNKLLNDNPILGDLPIKKRNTDGCDVCNPYSMNHDEDIYDFPKQDEETQYNFLTNKYEKQQFVIL